MGLFRFRLFKTRLAGSHNYIILLYYGLYKVMAVTADVPAAYYTSQFRAKGGKPVRGQWDRLEWGDDIWNCRAPGIYYYIILYARIHRASLNYIVLI